MLGSLHSPDDQAELITLLSNFPSGEALHLEFYDADILPNNIIALLALCIERRITLKIVTYRSLLSHSLMRLGFAVRQMQAKKNQTSLTDCRAIVIGGSANSLDKILHIIENLPVSEVSIFVVQHVSEHEENLLDQLLRVRTEYAVIMPQHLMTIQAGTIYIAPPGHHMKVAHGKVYLTRDQKIQFARPSLDALFESIAEEYGKHALALLLCGFGADGVAGCHALKAKGACVIIEDPQECGIATALPEAVQKTGNFDHVLRHRAITSIAASTVQAVVLKASGRLQGQPLEIFLDALWQEYAYDLRGYQRASLERRLFNLMQSFGLPDFCDFQRAVFSDPGQFMRLVAEISVGVTDFFRHPEQLLDLREHVLPYLESFPIIKIWSAGCSTGEEAYSLAILLEEMGLNSRSRLFATDINHYFLEVAKSGLYPLSALDAINNNYLKSGGSRSIDSHIENKKHYLKMNDHLRDVPLFYPHSLANGGIFNEFQLIVCRNVMIYFDTALQNKILQQFSRSLHRDGILVLGPQDGIRHLARQNGFVPFVENSDIYRLQEGTRNE